MEDWDADLSPCSIWQLTIDTEIKAKRDNIISELITLRIAKAKAKENSGGGGVDEIHLKLDVMPTKIIGIKKLKKRKRKRINMLEN